MSSANAPLAELTRIVILGLRNAGKSSLMNSLFERTVSIVSDVPGTTTDPVTRHIELGEMGECSITDTGGLDDEGELGGMRIRRSLELLSRGDVFILASRQDVPPSSRERELAERLAASGKPWLTALTFCEGPLHPEKASWADMLPVLPVDNMTGRGIEIFRERLCRLVSTAEVELTPLEGLVNEGDLVVMVVPVDLAAPKGRLIMPQVAVLRDLLDRDCAAMVVKDRELSQFWPALPRPPKLVVTDSQAFSRVAADIPEHQPLTSFSILFARKKGDLLQFTLGIGALSRIPGGAKVLVLEACSHHRQADDIGTVKIPRLFRQLVQADTVFEFARQLPPEDELREYSAVIHCGGCMVKQGVVLRRLERLRSLGIPAINYGLFLAWANGLLPRALEPFPEVCRAFLESVKKQPTEPAEEETTSRS